MSALEAAESFNAQANQAYKDGLCDQALQLYTQAIECDPSGTAKYFANRAAVRLQTRYHARLITLALYCARLITWAGPVAHCSLRSLPLAACHASERALLLTLRLPSLACNTPSYASCFVVGSAYLRHVTVDVVVSEYDLAMSDATAALQSEPNHLKALLRRALALAALGQHDASLSDLRQLLDTDPDVVCHAALMRLCCADMVIWLCCADMVMLR